MALAGAVVSFALIATACSKSDDGDGAVTPGGTEATPETGAPGGTEAPTGTGSPGTTEPEATPQPGGTLVMGIEAETSSPWRPAEMVCAISCHMIARSVYDTLMLPGEDNLAHPYLADSIESNDDYTEWRITARPNVSFHDGTPFDGAAIAENLNRHKTALLTGTVLKDVTSVTVDPADPMVAVVTMSRPWAAFPLTLTGQIGYMASPKWLKDSDADETLRAKPVGTGPFVFQDYKPNEYFKATRNPNYWNAPYPYLDAIEFRPISDGLQRRDALKAGDVDIIHTGNGQTIAEFRSDPGDIVLDEITNKAETAYTLLHVTQEGSALTDQRVRCALAYATDNQTVIDTIGAGVAPIANGPFSPTQVGHLDDTGYPTVQDMAKAQELIADYKADHPGKLTIALATTDDQTNLTIANFQKQWFEEAGVDEVTIDQILQGQYIVTALMGNFQAFQWRQHGGFDLDLQYHWWHSSSALPVGQMALNFGRIRDTQLDELLDENRITTDPAKKKEIAEAVNRLFAEQCYNLWGSWTVWGIPHKADVHGVQAFELPDGALSQPGSGIGGTFYLQTVWRG